MLFFIREEADPGQGGRQPNGSQNGQREEKAHDEPEAVTLRDGEEVNEKAPAHQNSQIEQEIPQLCLPLVAEQCQHHRRHGDKGRQGHQLEQAAGFHPADGTVGRHDPALRLPETADAELNGLRGLCLQPEYLAGAVGRSQADRLTGAGAAEAEHQRYAGKIGGVQRKLPLLRRDLFPPDEGGTPPGGSGCERSTIGKLRLLGVEQDADHDQQRGKQHGHERDQFLF